MCLRVVAEADPSSLMRILQVFQQLNHVPRRVSCDSLAAEDLLQVEVDVIGLSEERVRSIALKVAEMPLVLSAHVECA